MSIVLELTPDLEADLRQAAARAGVAPDAFIADALRERLTTLDTKRSIAPNISNREAELLLTVQQSMNQIVWTRYHELVAKCQAEQLTLAEQEELNSITDQVEAANVKRIGALVALAAIRGTSLPNLMHDLGLQPTNRG